MTHDTNNPRATAAENERIKRVLLWRESLSRLPDNHFFELMRMYLGEIKTPYNKQKLIEALGAFLHKPEIRERIASLLSRPDLQILSAVKTFSCPTQQLLTDFFRGEFPFAELYDRMMNLEERLLLFQHMDEQSGKRIYAVNPLLEDIVLPLVSESYLIPTVRGAVPCKDESPRVSAHFLGALLAFAAEAPLQCKQDGEFKKKTAQAIADKFPGLDTGEKQTFFRDAVDAALALSLFKQTDNGIEADFPHWEQFAKLSAKEQLAYLAGALCDRDFMPRIYQRAELVMSILELLPPEGLTEQALRQAEVLMLNGREGLNPARGGWFGGGRSRLSQIMGGSRSSSGGLSAPESPGAPQAAIRLGLLRRTANVSDGNDALPVYTAELPAEDESATGLVSVDSGFAVTVLPGLALSDLVRLACFMDLTRFDTAAVFELSRASCRRAFDMGLAPKDIAAEIQRHISYPLPQHLAVSLDDWFQSYKSAVLYKGYVLHFTDGRDASKNPVLSRYILKTLEPGVHMMDFSNDEEAMRVLARSGLENMGGIKTKRKAAFMQPVFQRIHGSRSAEDGQDSGRLASAESQEEFRRAMEAELAKLSLTQQQSDGLLARIRRSIILVPQQLRGDSVRLEVLEAGGMDFPGKIHVAEQAHSTGTLLELTYGVAEQEKSRVLGSVVKLEKRGTDTVVTLKVEPEQGTETFSLGQAALVRRLRGAIFRE